VPTLVGLSRKSMLFKPLDISPKEALNATTCANTIALTKGTNILRVHDVKEAIEAIKNTELLKNN
jgi:dihydropteroate synthase